MEGGTKLASSFKFALRDREDPRFVDRRMQSLLRVLNEQLNNASTAQTSQLLYSLVKLRLPDDDLINALTERSEILLDEMTPKELATTVWSLARLDYPTAPQLRERLTEAIKAVLTQISEEPYLFEAETNVDQLNLLNQEIQ